MCTVFAYAGRRLDGDAVLARLEKTKDRGPDATSVIPVRGGGYIAFQRLSIMGLDERGMQPFVRNRILSVTNGEIYGFRKIREELEAEGVEFSSESDCEVVIPMWEKWGTDMFRMLDAEFATVIHDPQRGFVAARDPIGIRPLFYGCDEDGAICFASEARLLLGLCAKIRPFPPGHYWADGAFTPFTEIWRPGEVVKAPLDEVLLQIRERLVAGVEKRLDSDAPLAFLLSGGLDSSLVCSIAARKLDKPIRTFSIGMEKDAIDAKYARVVAEHLGADHTEVLVTRDQAIGCLEEVIANLATWDITTIRASIGMHLICKWIKEHTDVRVLLTGEVSDELFGYKYTDFAPSPEAFQAESEKRVRELHAYDVLRADRCIADNSIEARVPFGDLAFASYVLSIDPKVKMNTTGRGKWLLRKAFEDGDWLPDSILWRDKAAFSDAVGHSLVDDLKEYAREMYAGKDWKAMCMKYPEQGRPFTEESLLYREIFESLYPGQAEMIPGFWMPNPDWEGCKVDDPSARVLPNYGDSGK